MWAGCNTHALMLACVDARTLLDDLNLFSAHELRAWLIRYSPVVLHGSLPEAFYQHHLLLSESIYLLLRMLLRKMILTRVQKS